MFQITLPDTENNRKLVEYLRTIDHAEVVESDDSLPLPSVDQRVKRALECLKREGLIQKKYDYVWIMEYVNEGLLPGNPCGSTLFRVLGTIWLMILELKA